jgi:pimeloyl-ACP methyl ester carboxylesterase
MFSDRAALRTFEANDVRLSYRDSGDPTGAPVVLLHGSGSDAATWDRFILRLTAVGYRCIALDLRGHASSARTEDYSLSSIRDDVLRLLEALALRNVTLIGHSVGGYAALAAALHTPERIARLVLEDLTAAIPHARLTAIPVGHRVHSLAPERFATEVMAFLAEPFDNCLPVTDTHLHPTPADAPSSSAERRPVLH